MTQYHTSAFRRRSTTTAGRTKRPLVVLIYRDNCLADIHSSTPAVQFVRLDVARRQIADTESAAFPPPMTARALAVRSLVDLSPDLHRAAQRAFRRS